MNNSTIARRFARYFALPIVSAGIIAGTALGLAGAASASTTDDVRPPHIVATPDVKAHPAPDAVPGHLWHHGVWHLADLQPSYTR
jgi:hypothetical protein